MGAPWSRAARQAGTGCRGPPRALNGSSPPPQASRSSRKGIAFGKRSNSMKRNPTAAVTKSGWLYKQVAEPPAMPAVPPASQPPVAGPPPRVGAALTAPLSQASSGVKQWNKRWFVLVDRCLFYYKGRAARAHPGAPALASPRCLRAVTGLGAAFASAGKGSWR